MQAKHRAPEGKPRKGRRLTPGRSTSALALALALVVALGVCGFARAAARLDPSFGDKGVAFNDDGGHEGLNPALGVAQDRRGRLVTVGNTEPGGERYYVVRFLRDGSTDLSFGNQGVASRGYSDVLSEIAIQPNGRIVIGGSSGHDSVTSACASLKRLMPDGTPDSSFGGPKRPGRYKFCLIGLFPRSVAIGGDRKILVGGVTYKNWRRRGAFIARLTPDGRLDHSLRGDRRTATSRPGIVELTPRHRHKSAVGEVKALRGGKILVGGYLRGRFMVARLERDGSLDHSFGRAGVASFDVDGSKKCECSFGDAIARDRHGRIVLAGQDQSDPYDPYDPYHARLVVVRLHPNGRLDRSFGRRGVVRPPVGREFLVGGMGIQRDGRIVVSGQAGVFSGLVRLNPNGSLDSTFFEDGLFTTTWVTGSYGPAWDVLPWDMLIDHRGRIVASDGTGGGQWGSGYSLVRLVRILPGHAVRCGKRYATILGTRGADNLRGTPRRDVIAAGRGADTIRGATGNDLICGGRGDDRLFGQKGKDHLLGGRGNDLLDGGAGCDSLAGGRGRDRYAAGRCDRRTEP